MSKDTAGRFLREALAATSAGFYQIRSRPWGAGDTWEARLRGILARQRGRHDHDGNRPDQVAKLAFEVAIRDVDDLLTLIAAAAKEEGEAQADGEASELAKLQREVRDVFGWNPERGVIEQLPYEGSSDLSPGAWPHIAAAVLASPEFDDPAGEHERGERA